MLLGFLPLFFPFSLPNPFPPSKFSFIFFLSGFLFLQRYWVLLFFFFSTVFQTFGWTTFPFSTTIVSQLAPFLLLPPVFAFLRPMIPGGHPHSFSEFFHTFVFPSGELLLLQCRSATLFSFLPVGTFSDPRH